MAPPFIPTTYGSLPRFGSHNVVLDLGFRPCQLWGRLWEGFACQHTLEPVTAYRTTRSRPSPRRECTTTARDYICSLPHQEANPGFIGLPRTSALGRWGSVPIRQTGVRRELAEAALAHVVGNKTEAAYNRTALVEQRRPIMEAWTAFIYGRDLRAVG